MPSGSQQELDNTDFLLWSMLAGTRTAAPWRRGTLLTS